MSPGKTQPPCLGLSSLNPLNVSQVVLSCCGKALDEEEAPGPTEMQHLRKGGGGGREEKWGEGSQVSCRVPQFSPQHRQVPADPLIALENLTFYRNEETLLFLPCFSL